MAAGLFELRKDPITGWWVATVVDRAFHRDRFARAAGAGRRPAFGCANCSSPAGRRRPASGCSRTSRSTSSAPTTRRASSTATRASPRSSLAQARATGSWRTVVAPPGRAPRRSTPSGNERHRGPPRAAPATRSRRPRTTGQTEYLDGRPELGRPGRRADEPPLPRPVRPAPDPAPDRRGARRRGAVRHPRRASARSAGSSARRSRRPDRLVWEDADSVAFAPYASRSPFEVWVVPRRHEADFGRADATGHRGDRGGAAPGPRRASPRASTGRPTTSSSTRRRCASRSTRPTTGTGRSTRACARSRGSSWEPACRSTPSRRRTRWRSSWAAPSRREVRRVERLPCRAPAGVTPGGGPPSLGHTSAPSHGCALRRPIRTEPSWPSTVRSPTFATRSAARRRPVAARGRPMSGAWDRDEAAAFVETLFAKHHGEIYAYLLRMMRDPEVAADMTQDAFIKAYKNYETLEKPENARAWLYQIAHRVALDEIRRRKIVRFLPWTGESRGAAPVGRAPRHGRPPVGRHAARARADPRAPARGPPPRRAARPDRPRAGRRARRQPRRRPSPPDPGPREPPPGARRRTRGGRRGRRRHDGRGTANGHDAGRTDEPVRARPRAGPTTGPRRTSARGSAPPSGSTARSTRPRRPGSTSISRAAPACRRVAAAYDADRHGSARAARPAPPSRRATCGRAPPPRIEQEAARPRPPPSRGRSRRRRGCPSAHSRGSP